MEQLLRSAESTDLSGAEWRFAFAASAPGCAATIEALAAAGLAWRPCRVPGNFEIDLHAVGLAPDPFHGLNILEFRQYERCHTWYATRFCAEPVTDGLARLVLEGVDCYATVCLNGEAIGECDNMLVEHVFDVTGRLRRKNELVVHVRPSLLEAQRFDYPPLLAASGLNWESLHVRKAPHMYGWDIMPRALSAGLWRPVRLALLPREGIESCWLETVALRPDGTARLRLSYRLRGDGFLGGDHRLTLRAACGPSRFECSDKAAFGAGQICVDVPEPRLWWPRGYGDPALYEVSLSLHADSREIDRLSFVHGIRTVALERTSLTAADGRGEFVLRVNGEKVFCKGSNWVPLDAFHSRDEARLDRAFAMVADLECNILRCWGGNVYESDRFFDLCDRHGVMVWQDFAMACAVYPQDESFQRRLRAEAVKVVRRLRGHPSLVLWAGDNECDQAWGWHHRGDPNGNLLTRRVLPEVLREEDPLRPYLPSSPYVDAAAHAALSRPHGPEGLGTPEDHLWGPRDYYKSPFYLTASCHFASEVGYHGCPDPASLREFLSPGRVWPYRDNPEWVLHSTNPALGTEIFSPPEHRVLLMERQVRALFGEVPDSLDDFAFASQAVQAEALKFFIERFRGAKWRRTGIVWWNLLDGWPQFSDAIVDYYFRRKLAYDWVRQAQQHVALMVREEDDGTRSLVAANDTRRDVSLEYAVHDADSGVAVLSGRGTATANASTVLAPLPDRAGQYFLRIAWTAAGRTGANHYLAGTPPFRLEDYRRWVGERAASYGGRSKRERW